MPLYCLIYDWADIPYLPARASYNHFFCRRIRNCLFHLLAICETLVDVLLDCQKQMLNVFTTRTSNFICNDLRYQTITFAECIHHIQREVLYMSLSKGCGDIFNEWNTLHSNRAENFGKILPRRTGQRKYEIDFSEESRTKKPKWSIKIIEMAVTLHNTHFDNFTS